MKVFTTSCPRNCYSTCSFKVGVENGKIINISPQALNRATPEGICLKGLSYLERVYSPNRILHPLRKKNGTFTRISWEEAINEISEKLIYFKTNFGPQSVLFYFASGTSGLLNAVSMNF